MQFKVKNSVISFRGHGDAFKEAIAFQVKPEGRDKISIANKYVFSGWHPSKNEEEVCGRLTIEKLDNSSVSDYKFDENKLGKVSFYEAHVDEFASYSIPPLICFSIFLKEERFDEIKQAMLHGLPIAYLSCEIDGLDFGWEPDGSHQKWMIREGEEIRKFNSLLKDAFITDFGVGFGKSFDDEYWEGRGDNEGVSAIRNEVKRGAIITAWLDKNGWYAVVAALVIGYLFFK